MRLIDADALFEDCLFSSPEFELGLKEFINDAPTIDAVPVKHGEWVVINGCVCCSVCGEPCMEFNYCPNCGAKMDEVEE